MSRLGFLVTVVLSVGLAHGIGVNWGTIASHPLQPSIVVQMLRDNGINKVKLFDANAQNVGALAGTNIEVMLGIPNDQLAVMADYYDSAEDWVKENVTKYINKGVNIKYVIGFGFLSHRVIECYCLC